MKKRKCEELSTPIRRPRVTPRSLHVYNPHTSTIGTFTPPCKPKLPVQFSHSTTMHILNQHPSYTPPRTAVWCASGAEHGVRSGGVEGYGPSRLELFLGGGRKKMRRSIWTKMTRLRRLTSQTLVNCPRSSAHGYFHPYRKPKHPTKTRSHPTMTIGVFMPSPVVHLICRTAQGFGGSLRVCDWIGVRSGGHDGWRAGPDVASKSLG